MENLIFIRAKFIECSFKSFETIHKIEFTDLYINLKVYTYNIYSYMHILYKLIYIYK